MQSINFKFLLKTFDWLEKKIKILNNIFSIKIPFFWATNIVGGLFFNFVLYIIATGIYFLIPVYIEFSKILLSLIYISPLCFLIYLNNCFQNKEKHEILILKFSIFKLLLNNFLYLIISFSFFYLSIIILEYKITIKYDNDQIKLIDDYYNKKNELILKYKNILNISEKITKNNEIIDKIEEELFNEESKNELFYEYQDDLKSFLYPYGFLKSSNNYLDINSIEKEVDAIKDTKQTVDSIKSIYYNYTFVIIVFSVIYIFGFFSNISNLSILNFALGFMCLSALLTPMFIFELGGSTFVLVIVGYLIKKFSILNYYREILFYVGTIVITSLYSYYVISIEEKYFSISSSNITFLFILIIWSTLWYIFYFRLKLLAPKIVRKK